MTPRETPLVFYDTHAHLDYPDFSGDLEAVIARAASAGVRRIITVGTDLESSARAISLSERFPAVFAVVGWHPTDAHKAPADVRPALSEMARHPKVVAIGETGLDYYHLPSSRGAGSITDDEHHKKCQARLFEQQMEVAVAAGLGCIVHQRNSLADTLAQMQPFENKLRAVFHCFGEELHVAKGILDQGWLVSFTGVVTFKNARRIRDTLAAIPLPRLMLETDCPFLAPVPHRGKRCEPAHVVETAKIIAEVKHCSLDALSAATCAAAHEFFRKLTAERAV